MRYRDPRSYAEPRIEWATGRLVVVLETNPHQPLAARMTQLMAAHAALAALPEVVMLTQPGELVALEERMRFWHPVAAPVRLRLADPAPDERSLLAAVDRIAGTLGQRAWEIRPWRLLDELIVRHGGRPEQPGRWELGDVELARGVKILVLCAMGRGGTTLALANRPGLRELYYAREVLI